MEAEGDGAQQLSLDVFARTRLREVLKTKSPVRDARIAEAVPLVATRQVHSPTGDFLLFMACRHRNVALGAEPYCRPIRDEQIAIRAAVAPPERSTWVLAPGLLRAGGAFASEMKPAFILVS